MKKSKVIIPLLLLAFVLAAGVFFQRPASAEKETLTGLSADEIASRMGLGWNLGNTLDATGGTTDDVYSHETSWGNPRVTKELIQGVKAEGFNTIRIPTTWYNYMDENYVIQQAYMDRVKEIVGWAYDEGMFIILNVHHEEWVNDPDIDKNYAKIGYQLAKVWEQIADNFADFDQHLIFEGMNEPRAVGKSYEWSGNSDCYAAVNYLVQVFANTVRASDKGYNKERALMIPGYAASSSSQVMNSISLPVVDGKVCNNLIASVHCYSPYDFCLSDKITDFNVSDSSVTGGIDMIFNDIDSIFLSKGIPAVIGETSATAKNNVAAREKWARYMGEKSAAYGVPIVIWDNGYDGNSGGESHAHMNRSTNKANYPTVFAALFDGYNSVTKKSARKKGGSEAPASSEGTVIWSDAAGNTSKALWDISFLTLGSKPAFYLDGRDIVIEYSGSGEPKMILDSEAKQQWWMPVDPSGISEKGGKHYATFKNADIKSVLASFGITNTEDLRNLCFIAANDNITAYSVTVTGGAPIITFIVNGATYASGSELPADPSFTNMKFLGWYSEKDYREGSEYKGGTVSQDIIVYAKFELTDEAFSENNKPEAKPTEAAPTEAAPTEAAPTESSSDTKPTEGASENKPAEEASSDGESGGYNSSEHANKLPSDSDSSDKSDGLSKGAIVAIIGAVLVAVIVVAEVIIYKKAKKKGNNSTPGSDK